MNPEIAVPSPDPVPLPAPFFLFKALLLLTFFLHLLAMNGLLGGSVMALVSRLRRGGGDARPECYRGLVKKLPSFMAAAITLGVAPLLFVQVLYGQALYTSSILMAWPWLLLLLLLVAAYYGLYGAAFRSARPGAPGRVLLASALLLLLAVAFLFTNNFSLMQTPDSWLAKYRADPSGWNLNLAEGTLFPRFLHMVFGAVAVAGLFTALLGRIRWEKNREEGAALVRLGGKGFLYAAMVQVVLGAWYLLALPKDKAKLFMGRDPLATGFLTAGAVLLIAALVMAGRALRRDDPRPGVRSAAILGILVLAFMVLVRDRLRDAYLAPHVIPSTLPVDTQWSPMVLFFVLFLGGVGLWIRMLGRYFRESMENEVS